MANRWFCSPPTQALADRAARSSIATTVAPAPPSSASPCVPVDAYTPAVALTRQLFQAFQSSPTTLARRQAQPAQPDSPARKLAQDI